MCCKYSALALDTDLDSGSCLFGSSAEVVQLHMHVWAPMLEATTDLHHSYDVSTDV